MGIGTSRPGIIFEGLPGQDAEPPSNMGRNRTPPVTLPRPRAEPRRRSERLALHPSTRQNVGDRLQQDLDVGPQRPVGRSQKVDPDQALKGLRAEPSTCHGPVIPGCSQRESRRKEVRARQYAADLRSAA